MELIERRKFLSLMHSKFENVKASEGHCILVSGEAGIGKTSLVKTFCKPVKKECRIYQGTCDALFTPRPLGPVFDIVWQMHGLGWEHSVNISDRSALFTRFYYELENQQETTIIIIEDIHWADEATLDFIKFFARRITRLHCLFILTYRGDEINSHHPLRTVLGHLPPDSITRLQLGPLSREAVEKMAVERGYDGENVYSISGGNPFYVNEILASYSPGIPDTIRDSILSIYNCQSEKTKKVWQILSVLPTGFEIRYLEKMEPLYATAIQDCLDAKILIAKDGLISFKHELYRRTTETALSPLVRMALNKRILDLFLKSFEHNQEIERIIHHAKNANEYETVVKYAPVAARQAAMMGAHIEAAKLYLTAIEYYQESDSKTLNQFYESYAYECYLTNQIREAIIYTTKALKHWDELIEVEKKGNCLRFLSRLWWLDGNRKKAEFFASQAIEVLEGQPTSTAKAMAYSNMSQLKMLSNEFDECITWGEKAIEMAKDLADEEIVCHALNNVGASQTGIPALRSKGIELLQQSLQIAMQHSYDDHAGRAYANLASNAVT
ncbi:MAG TPA: AAA family ATPase, partial [Chitinophagaceae bacterium]|nr:AAA family ATPase [Chitinophagaceae bacterium]